MQNGEIVCAEIGTDGDSSANEACLADHLQTTGIIYFIRAGRTANVKIGWTTVNARKRLDALQTGSPHRLHLIGYTPGGREAEMEWHERWRSHHVRGEWFHLVNELRWAINAVLAKADAVSFIHITTDRRTAPRHCLPL